MPQQLVELPQAVWADPLAEGIQALDKAEGGGGVAGARHLAGGVQG